MEALSPAHFLVRDTLQTGRGVFAATAIRAGTMVLRLEGRTYTTQDVPPDSFAMQVGRDLWLCSDGTALDDCVNHGCEPNTGFAKRDPVLYALRDITPGEELTWDYSTSISESGWSLACLCGAMKCRRIILPFHELAAEVQMRLRPISLRYLDGAIRKE